MSPFLSVQLGSYPIIQESVARAPQCPCRFITLLGLKCLLLLLKQKSTFVQQLHTLLQTKRIKSSDPDMLIDYIISKDIFSFKDLNNLDIDDLKEENTGLKPIQQRKFLSMAREHCDSDAPFEAWPVANYSQSRQREIKASIQSQSVATSVRYVLCQDLFVKDTEERKLAQVYLNSTTIKDLIMGLCAKEEICQDLFTLELFTHEGYPININKYNEHCPLIKWGFKESSLIYLFIRKMRQTGIIENKVLDQYNMDVTRGAHSLQIHSVLYGCFSVVSDIKKDTGENIKQKIYIDKGLPPESFKLITWPKNHAYISECIDEWTNEKIQSWLQDSSSETSIADVMLITKPLYTCRGGNTYCFGKCTYTPLVEQSDEGYSKFYSILFLLMNDKFKGDKCKVLTFIHKEYNLPPLTYALKVLFANHFVEQFPLWVALVEGLFQIFVAILKKGFEVPENEIFECSEYLWGMICKQSDNLQDSECLKWTSTPLLCKLSNLKMVEPVTLPQFSDVCEAQAIRAMEGTSCENFDINQNNVRRVDEIKRLLMLSDFHNCNTFITWEGNSNMISSIGPLELPTVDVPLEHIYEARDHFTDYSSSFNLVFYQGQMAVIMSGFKEKEVEIYDPLYCPEDNNGYVTVEKSLLAITGTKELDLKKYAKQQGILTTATSAICLRCFRRWRNESSVSQYTTDIKNVPFEAIVVVFDCGFSVNSPIESSGPSISLLHTDHFTAAQTLLKSFLNRTEAFEYHHAVGLVICSANPKVEVLLTDDFDHFQDKIGNLKRSSQSALYDSILKASQMLISLKREYPGCKRRILCLTNGRDSCSKCGIDDCFTTLKQQDILLDTIIITGTSGNIDQKAITHGTGGFCFLPQSMEEALKIFETETVLSSSARMIRQEPLQNSLAVYKDISKYPFNETTFYGQQDLQTEFSQDVSKKNYSHPSRVVQKTMHSGEQTLNSSSNLRNRRILQEMQHCLRNPHPFIEIYPQEENISQWKIVLLGPELTPYEGGTFILYAKFPETYPEKPPEIRFETPIYHCNINSNGRICHRILDTKYVPKIKIKTLLEYIYGLLMSPEPSDPLDSVLALELNTNRVEYERRARELVERFAKGTHHVPHNEIVPDDGDAPSSMICPLTGKLYVDPVTTEYGHTYEQKALMEYLSKNNNMDPLVRKPVSVDKITPNLNLRKMVEVQKKF